MHRRASGLRVSGLRGGAQGSCLLLALCAASCQPHDAPERSLGDDSWDPESAGEAEQAISVTPTRVESASTKATLPTPDPSGDVGRLGFVTASGPDPVGLYAVTGSNIWQREGLDIYNVVDYGASPVDANDDTVPIQRAIDAAASSRGGVIYFPRGDYDVTDSLVLPRSYTKPLIFQGDGRLASTLSTEGNNLSTSRPVITFDPASIHWSKYYGFRDLTIGRSNDGTLFRHLKTDPSTRLSRAVFERLQLLGYGGSDQEPAPTEKLVHIEGGTQSIFNDVVFIGGHTALALESCSHITINHVTVESDHWANNGIRLSGGGSHSLHHVRLDATDGGTALDIDAGPAGIADIQIDGVFGEGKRTQYFIKLTGYDESRVVKQIIMKDINIPAPWGPGNGVTWPSYGIHMNDWVRNVRVLNSRISTWSTNLTANGGQPIHVGAGAKHIDIEQVLFGGHIENNGLHQYVDVEPGAQRVRVELIDQPWRRAVREEGMIEDMTVLGGVGYVGASGVVRASAAGTIGSLAQGRYSAVADTPSQAGQRVILLGSAANPVFISNTGNLRLSTSTFTLTTNCILQLVHDGTDWQEVSRSCN